MKKVKIESPEGKEVLAATEGMSEVDRASFELARLLQQEDLGLRRRSK